MLTAKNILLIFVFFIGSIFGLQSQTTIDSLKSLLNQTQNDTPYVDILNNLSKLYRYNDPVIALDYAVKAEKIAQNCNYHQGLAMAYHHIGVLYADKGNLELAIDNYNQALKIFQLFNNQAGIADTYGNMGLIYQKQKLFDKALDYQNKSLEIRKVLHDSIGIAYTYGNIGLIYSEQGKYDKALIQFYNSLRLKETQKDKFGMANSYNNIGVIYFEIESFDQAQVNLERSLTLFEDLKNKAGIAESELYLGEIYQRQNDYVKAIDALNRSLELNKELGRIEGIADAYLKIGKINAAIGKPHTAYDNYLNSLNYYESIQNNKGIVLSRIALAKYYFEFEDFESAKMQLKKSNTIAEENQLLKENYEISKLLADIYLQQENFYKAALVLVEANKLSDSLCAKNLNREITQIQMQYEFDKRMQQKEVESLRLNTGHQLRVQKIQMVRNIIIGALLLICIIAFIIYRKSVDTKRKSKILVDQRKQIDIHIETLQKQKLALEKANHTKDKFLSIIGHDLRNPFNAINSFVSLVTEHPNQMDHEKLMKYLYLIKDAGANAMSLLENLLEWAKTQSGEIVARKENVLINYILRGNLLLIKEMARQKNIELIESLEGNPTVNIDKNMINTVIRNLLSNALKFTNSGGKIWVKTIINNNEIKVIVQDTGVGISEEMLINLFEPGVIKHGRDGMASSGLGLILCKEFLLQHHQELRVDSKINFGTTFWFYLPLA